MSPEDQNKWISEHIPHRVKASIACLLLQEDLIRRVGEGHRREITRDCHGSAIMQGRLAAIRWLIEFIGVQGIDKHGKAKRSSKRNDATDKLITDIGDQASAFDLSSQEAVKLGKVWEAISKACSHATDGTNHDSLEDVVLLETMQIVMAHLDRTIYASANQSLSDTIATSCKGKG